jgi:hypothetical protein
MVRRLLRFRPLTVLTLGFWLWRNRDDLRELATFAGAAPARYRSGERWPLVKEASGRTFRLARR